MTNKVLQCLKKNQEPLSSQIKIRAEINNMEAKRTMQKSMNQRGRISNIDKPFTKLPMREDTNQ
jgi:hypothetical protein